MATEQVMHWINRDVKLSKVIHSFETDFSNGYLFGEILCQYGVYDDLSMFSKKINKEAKVNNFYLIEDALRHMKVRFDGKLTHNIMQEERGAALRLLYQIKLAIQKRQGPAPDALEAETMTGLKMGTVQKKFQQNMEKTMTVSGSIQPRTVKGKDVRTGRQRREDNHLMRFQVAKKSLFDTALAQNEQERDLVNSLQQQKRSDNRRKLRDNQEFMKEWEQEGTMNWALNRQKRQDTMARQKYFEDREINLFKAKLSKELDEATSEMRSGISEFDKNLQKLGIEQNVNMEDAVKRMEEKQGIPPGQIQNFSFPATMNKIKETKKQSDFAGKERERRRRKLAVDQAKTQERLDKQKQEDMLIQKLMKQQLEEQNDAYRDERLRKCKTMLGEARRERALEVQRIRGEKYKVMEQQSKVEAKSREFERKQQIERQKEEYRKINWNKKMGKRGVNIEIASGIVDLVLDLADEVYDVTQAQNGKKLTKAQWREFSGIFVDGKKVSLRNIKKQIVDTDAVRKDDDSGLQVPDNIPAYRMLQIFSKEPALHDLFQFISNSGLFNLDQLKPELVQHWSEMLKLEQFLVAGNGGLVKNEALGHLLMNLYGVQAVGSTTHRSPINSAMRIEDKFIAEEIKEAADEGEEAGDQGQIPTKLPLKLAILGRAFSGKKTIAAQLQEKYGGAQNTKLFNMDEIIKEALDYITPKKIDEAALEAAKKAKKGKAEEVVNVDIFEGKNVAQYKKLATEMKEQFFKDYEGDNLPQSVDLPNLVFDDQLLVNIFIERLKLEYEGVNLEVSKEDLEAGIRREKELVEQLADLEDHHTAADPKKGAKGAPKGGKAPDETIKDELESIRTVAPQGWILLDFPRNLTQMKLLETSLSGFESKADLAKDQGLQKYETWAQIATPPTLIDEGATGVFEAHPSGFDGVLVLETPQEECTRRANGRKIDPQTQQIYHMESNAPEDAKVLERLQDYIDPAADPERMNRISTGFTQAIGSIKQWLTKFGLKEEDGSCAVQLDMVIKLDQLEATQPAIVEVEGEAAAESEAQAVAPKDPWTDKSRVLDQVFSKVNRIMAFRQGEYNRMRDQVRSELEEQERTKAEEEQRAADEAKRAAEQAENKKESEQDGEAAAVEVPSQKKSQQEEERPDTTGKQSSVQQQDFLHIEVGHDDDGPDPMKTMSSSKRLLSEHMHSVGGTSKSIGRSTKFMQRIQELSDRQKLAKWEEMLSEYYSEGMQSFHAMRALRQRVCRSLNDTQRKFVNYLGRSSDQQRRINEYCENYNRFSREFPDLIGNTETQKELLNRVDILSKQLWENIKARKDESLQERLSYMEGGWVQIEMVKLCSFVARLVGNEYRRFMTISAIATGHIVNENVDLEDVTKKLTERGVDSYVENEKDRALVGSSPLLLEVAQTILTKVEALFNEQFVLSLDLKISSMLNIERENFSMRLNLLFTWASLILHEISSQAFQVFDVLDDWIVIAVKRENQSCQQAVKEIKAAVCDGQMHLEPITLQGLDLERHISTLEFYEGPPQYMVEVRPMYTIEQSRFSVESLTLVYKQFRAHQEDTKLIDLKTFQTLMLLNLQQGVLPNVWRYVPFDSVILLARRLEAKPPSDNSNGSPQVKLFGQGRNNSTDLDAQRTFMDWRRAFTILALIAGRLPSEEELEAYKNKLRAQLTISDEGIITKKAFIKVEAWFDKCEQTPLLQTLAHSPTKIHSSPSHPSGASPMSSPSPNSYSAIQMQQQEAMNSDEDEDEVVDEERLDAVKAMIFDTYRIQNRQGLMLNDFEHDLDFIFREKREGEDDVRNLYHTMLCMQE